MENQNDLIQALVEEGIDPSQEEIEKLDAQITELAEILVDFLFFKRDQHLDSLRALAIVSPNNTDKPEIGNSTADPISSIK